MSWHQDGIGADQCLPQGVDLSDGAFGFPLSPDSPAYARNSVGLVNSHASRSTLLSSVSRRSSSKTTRLWQTPVFRRSLAAHQEAMTRRFCKDDFVGTELVLRIVAPIKMPGKVLVQVRSQESREHVNETVMLPHVKVRSGENAQAAARRLIQQNFPRLQHRLQIQGKEPEHILSHYNRELVETGGLRRCWLRVVLEALVVERGRQNSKVSSKSSGSRSRSFRLPQMYGCPLFPTIDGNPVCVDGSDGVSFELEWWDEDRCAKHGIPTRGEPDEEIFMRRVSADVELLTVQHAQAKVEQEKVEADLSSLPDSLALHERRSKSQGVRQIEGMKTEISSMKRALQASMNRTFNTETWEACSLVNMLDPVQVVRLKMQKKTAKADEEKRASTESVAGPEGRNVFGLAKGFFRRPSQNRDPDKALMTLKLFQLVENGKPMREEDWLVKDFWLSMNGYLCWEQGIGSKREIVSLYDHSLATLDVRPLPYFDACKEYCFSVGVPLRDEMTFFAGLSAESCEEFIQAVRSVSVH